MKNEKTIPFLIQDDPVNLPNRGGDYVSQKELASKKMQQMKKKLAECNCDCHCDYHKDDKDCNC